MIKKINILLMVLFVSLGGVLFYIQMSKPNAPDADSQKPPVEEVIQGNESKDDGFRDIVDSKQPSIPEAELVKQIQDKEYLENTFMALEYSKINNAKLIDTIKSYLDDNTSMTEEDVNKLIEIHEKTFANRYLKVFVNVPSDNLTDLNFETRRVFYKMKEAFDTLSKFGAKLYPVASSETVQSTTKTEVTGIPSESPALLQPEITYNKEDLTLGIKQLESANTFVNEALKTLGEQDVIIEGNWVLSDLSEDELLGVLDTSNSLDLETIVEE